jgi:hypothetical protein
MLEEIDHNLLFLLVEREGLEPSGAPCEISNLLMALRFRSPKIPRNPRICHQRISLPRARFRTLQAVMGTERYRFQALSSCRTARCTWSPQPCYALGYARPAVIIRSAYRRRFGLETSWVAYRTPSRLGTD